MKYSHGLRLKISTVAICIRLCLSMSKTLIHIPALVLLLIRPTFALELFISTRFQRCSMIPTSSISLCDQNRHQWLDMTFNLALVRSVHLPSSSSLIALLPFFAFYQPVSVSPHSSCQSVIIPTFQSCLHRPFHARFFLLYLSVQFSLFCSLFLLPHSCCFLVPLFS